MVIVEFFGGPADGLVRKVKEPSKNCCVEYHPSEDDRTMCIYKLVEDSYGRKRYRYMEEI